jgi:GT2 family glycosyltransferase
MVRRDLYERVGGLDEEAFPVAFNDIDFCLRLGVQGLRTVWTPYAELIHKESVSRGFDDTPEKEERFQKEFDVFKMRWKDKMEDDPFYNPNLSIVSEDFSLIFPPRMRDSCPGNSG